MKEATVIAIQIALMFIFMAVGFVLYKTQKITPQGSKTIANLLVYAIMPAVMIKSFFKAPTAENISAFLISAIIGLLAIAISIIISRLFFKNAPISEFAGAFSNVGFLGVPLIQATSLGNNGVFYVVTFVAFVNIGQWTYGVMRITEKSFKDVFSLKKLFASPFVIATLIGCVLFFSGLGVELLRYEVSSKLVYGVLDGLSQVNAPLAMIIIGGYLAQTDLKKLVTLKEVYLVCLVRLIVIPLVTALIFWFIPNSYYSIKLAVLIAVICPVGANVAVYAELNGKDYSYAVKTVTLSTILSIVTMPSILALVNLLW